MLVIKNHMEAKPFFSIITASQNSDASIRCTLESMRKQTLQDIEHLVIDGESTDDTLSILKQYTGRYNLSWISEHDKGIADALNKAVAKSCGVYLLVIQADDQFLDQGILEEVFPLLRDEVYDVHSFPVIVDHPELGRFLRRPIPILWWNRFKFIFPHQGTFVHHRVFKRIGGFREDFSIAMDYDFFYRAILAGCTVKFHREPPVAMMGGSGIGTRPASLRRRLTEESLVQEINERNPLWRMGQIVFRRLYHPYKMWLLPALKRPGKSRPRFDSAHNQPGNRFPD
jgi:glycosyltransferase involved in cell wall biosynthesis